MSSGSAENQTAVTTVADSVVAKIAGIASREVSGVHDLGGSASRMVGELRERAGADPDPSRGVFVEVGESEAAVEIDLVAEHGISLLDLSSDVRRHVVTTVGQMTGLRVTRVDIAVSDLHVAGDDGDQDSPPDAAELDDAGR